MGLSADLLEIDRETLTPIVRRALDSDTAEVADWSCTLLHGRSEAALTGGGVFCITGTGVERKGDLPWSVVLKVTGPSLGAWLQPGQQENSCRELLAYRTGLLADIGGHLTAPRLLEGYERPDGRVWLWLEHVIEAGDPSWPLARYGVAARHLGLFNGPYLVQRPLPDYPWLGKDWLRQWLVQWSSPWDVFPSLTEHSLVRRGYPGDLADRTYRLWQERALLCDALDRVPRTLCHGDAFRGNLLARRREDGGDQTVALDWADSGIRPLGEELAPLVAGSVLLGHLEPEQLRELDGIAFEGYLGGLRDAGWRGDPRLLRLGYAAAAALRYGLTSMVLLSATWTEIQREEYQRVRGLSLEAIADRRPALQAFLLDLADEARELLSLAR